MRGLGTIINVAAIVIGGIAGMLFGKALTQKVQDSLLSACGVCVIVIGLGGAIAKMLVFTDGAFSSGGSLLLIASLVGGIFIGELLRIEDHLEGFGEWLKQKSGNAGDPRFVAAFVNTSLTVCVGAMAVVGSIEDGINGDYSVLLTKAILDLIIVMAMTVSLGKGAIFSAVSVGLFQGIMTLLSLMIAPLLTKTALGNIDFVGSVMILCVGINLVFGKKVRVANMLPGLIIAALWSVIP